jgi:hypothetical protein
LLIYQFDFRDLGNTLKAEGDMQLLSIKLEWGLFARVLLASKIPRMVSEASVTQVACMDFDIFANCITSNQMYFTWM